MDEFRNGEDDDDLDDRLLVGLNSASATQIVTIRLQDC
jgi:hypothetical protein